MACRFGHPNISVSDRRGLDSLPTHYTIKNCQACSRRPLYKAQWWQVCIHLLRQRFAFWEPIIMLEDVKPLSLPCRSVSRLHRGLYSVNDTGFRMLFKGPYTVKKWSRRLRWWRVQLPVVQCAPNLDDVSTPQHRNDSSHLCSTSFLVKPSPNITIYHRGTCTLQTSCGFHKYCVQNLHPKL